MGQPATPLCGSVSRRAQRGDSVAACLLEACLTLTLFPVTSPIPCMWPAPFQLLPWWCITEWVQSEFAYVLRPCRPFKPSFLRLWQFLLLPQPALVFTARSYGTGSLGCAVWPGAGIACSQGIPPDFYLPHMNVGLPVPQLPLPLCSTPHLLASVPISTTLPLLPAWVNVASLNPWLSDFHIIWFSDGSGCYLFWGLV